MTDESKSKGVNIDLSAGASLSAEIKTEVPSESSGRLLDALTDLIRPISEKRGFRADQIRLQREEVLIEIAKMARERILIENLDPQPIPNRILVPLLEHASLVESEDELLKDHWANLIASATRGVIKDYGLFIHLLSLLDSSHLQLMEVLGRTQRKINVEEDELVEYHLGRTPEKFIEFINKNDSSWAELLESADDKSQEKAVQEDLQSFFQRPGLFLLGGLFLVECEERWIEFENAPWPKELRRCIDSRAALIALRLCDEFILDNSGTNYVHWTATSYLSFTDFGKSFYEACTGKRVFWV